MSISVSLWKKSASRRSPHSVRSTKRSLVGQDTSWAAKIAPRARSSGRCRSCSPSSSRPRAASRRSRRGAWSGRLGLDLPAPVDPSGLSVAGGRSPRQVVEPEASSRAAIRHRGGRPRGRARPERVLPGRRGARSIASPTRSPACASGDERSSARDHQGRGAHRRDRRPPGDGSGSTSITTRPPPPAAPPGSGAGPPAGRGSWPHRWG